VCPPPSPDSPLLSLTSLYIDTATFMLLLLNFNPLKHNSTLLLSLTYSCFPSLRSKPKHSYHLLAIHTPSLLPNTHTHTRTHTYIYIVNLMMVDPFYHRSATALLDFNTLIKIVWFLTHSLLKTSFCFYLVSNDVIDICYGPIGFPLYQELSYHDMETKKLRQVPC
jgi:hypothetical protein